jgi:hypothetical protein
MPLRSIPGTLPHFALPGTSCSLTARTTRPRAEFSWPELDEFNWALDWFDVIAAEHPDRVALRIVADDGDSRERPVS